MVVWGHGVCVLEECLVRIFPVDAAVGRCASYSLDVRVGKDVVRIGAALHGAIGEG